MSGWARLRRRAAVFRPPDMTPDTFAMPAISNANPAQLYGGSFILIGIDIPVLIAAAGMEFSFDGATWRTAPTTVGNGDRVYYRAPAAGAYLATSVTSLTIGGVTAYFTITTKADPGILTIPTLLPQPGWDGTPTPLVSMPAKNWTPYGTVDDGIEASCQMKIHDLAVIDELTYVGVVAMTAAQDGIDQVFAAFEDGEERELVYCAHPVTGSWSWHFAIGDPAARNGLGRIRIRAVPFNGLERIFFKTLVLNANPSGPGYVERVVRYVNPAAANDGGDGLTLATAKKTIHAAYESFTTGASGERLTKICRVILPAGTVPHFADCGKQANGVAITFAYRPEVVGAGRKGTGTETRYSCSGMAVSPANATSSYSWRWAGIGPTPFYSNMWIDWANVASFYSGGVYGHFDGTSDIGVGVDANGFPIGSHKSEYGNLTLSNANAWRDAPSVAGYQPGMTGRWGGERHCMFDYTLVHFSPSTIQERWDGVETVGADSMFINWEGDWLISRVRATQGLAIELRQHVEVDLIVTAVQLATPASGKVTVSFTGTCPDALPNDPTNLLCRVVDSAAGVPAGDEPYVVGPDGTSQVSTTGYFVDASGSGLTRPRDSNQIVLLHAGTQLNGLAPGDKLRVFVRYHADSGQMNYDLGGQTYENRENFCIEYREMESEHSQPMLTQIGSLNSATTSNNGSSPAALAGYTVSTAGRIATFDPAIPPALKRHGWIEPKSGLSLLEACRVVRVIDASTVLLDRPFKRSSDGTAYDLPAGTTFAGYRGVHGYNEAGRFHYKSGQGDLLLQFAPGLSGSSLAHCTLIGWSSTNKLVTLRPRVTGWREGMFDLRIINSIVHAIDVDFGETGNLFPADFKLMNSHVEKVVPGANAQVSTSSTGYVFGYPSMTAPLGQAYAPGAGLTKTVLTPYLRRLRNGTQVTLATPIGSGPVA